MNVIICIIRDGNVLSIMDQKTCFPESSVLRKKYLEALGGDLQLALNTYSTIDKGLGGQCVQYPDMIALYAVNAHEEMVCQKESPQMCVGTQLLFNSNFAKVRKALREIGVKQ